MKALSGTVLLLLALFLGVIVWALANGTPLSGEPTALLDIEGQGKHPQLAHVMENPSKARHILSGGQAMVVLDVAPNGSAKRKPDHQISSDGLIEQSKYGPLPKRAVDGRSPARAYAKAKRRHRDALPRIAILVTGLGLNQRLTQQAVKKLPAEVSLAFSAYGRKLSKLVDHARSLGHEVMLQVPLEPLDYPDSDTGPKTLLVAHSEQENRPRLHWSLGRFTGYFGVVNNKGGRFLASDSAAGGLFKELQRRGLVFFRDSAGTSPTLSNLARKIGLGYSQASLEIDRKPTAKEIKQVLKKLEGVARRSGFAVGVAHMHPVSIQLISQWSKQLESRGYHLVPVSAAYGQFRS